MTVCPAPEHDTLTAYRKHRCRCPEARRQSTLDHNRYLLRRMRQGQLKHDATGIRRRLQALMAIGWSQGQLGRRLGVRNTSVSQLMRDPTWVQVRTSVRVRRLYEQLRDTPGPSARARSLAAGRGWLTPDWWDDDTIDDPRYDPALELEVTAAELQAQEDAHRLLEVHRLTEAGLSAQDVAARIGTSTRTVTRYRARWAEAS